MQNEVTQTWKTLIFLKFWFTTAPSNSYVNIDLAVVVSDFFLENVWCYLQYAATQSL